MNAAVGRTLAADQLGVLRFGVRDELRALPRLLHSGEEVLGLAAGTVGNWSDRLFVATDRRVLLVYKRRFRPARCTELGYAQIQVVRAAPKFDAWEMRVRTSGVEQRWHLRSAERAERFVRLVAERSQAEGDTIEPSAGTAPISDADTHATPPPSAVVTVVQFRDSSLVVPARVTTSDGQVGDGVTRIVPGHPQYHAWRSYCERHPEGVVDRRHQGRDTNEHLEAGLFTGVGFTAATFVFSAFRDEFHGVEPGTAVATGVVIFTFWFVVGFVGSLWAGKREETSGAKIKRSAAKVEPPPS